MMKNRNFYSVSGSWKCLIGVCALLLVTCSTLTSSHECVRDDRANTTLDKVTGSGVMIRELNGNVTSAENCASLCCQLHESDGCTVASFLVYYGSSLCMLARCQPISDCVMSYYAGSFTSIIGLPTNSSAPSSSPPPVVFDVIADLLGDVAQDESDVHTTHTSPALPTSATEATTTVTTRVEDGAAVNNLDLDAMSTTTAPPVSETTTWWSWDDYWGSFNSQQPGKEEQEEGGQEWLLVETTTTTFFRPATTTTAMMDIDNFIDWEDDSLKAVDTVAAGKVGDVRVSGDVEHTDEDENEEPEEDREPEMDINDVILRDDFIDQSEESRLASLLDSNYVTIASVVIVTSTVVMVIILLRRLQRAKRLNDYEKSVRHM